MADIKVVDEEYSLEWKMLEADDLVQRGDECRSRRYPKEWRASHRVGKQAVEFEYRRRVGVPVKPAEKNYGDWPTGRGTEEYDAQPLLLNSPNRIGDLCWFCRFDYKTKTVQDWKQGRLLAWSTDHEENEGNYGPFPVGVVEALDTGMCHAVSVERITFGPRPTGD